MAKQKCTYRAEYFDHEKGEWVIFECENEAVQDGLCIFHHPTYCKEHENEVREKFYDKVKASIKKGKPLKCIGYNLPEINLFNVEFNVPIYFEETIFSGKVNFRKSVFLREVSFMGATFSREVNLVETIFSGETCFTGATFLGKAYFVRATFLRGADFGETRFSEGAYFIGATFLEEADFFEAKFSKEAYFWGATFSGKAYFEVTVFSGEADFRGVKFFDSASFEYSRFLDETSFVDAYFSSGFLARSIDLSKYISFRDVYFERKDRVIFDGIDLSRVSFLYTNIDRVRFRNISNWGKYTTFDSYLLIIKNSEEEMKEELKKLIKHLEDIIKNDEKFRMELNRKFSRMRLNNDLLNELKKREREMIEDAISRYKSGKLIKEWKKHLEGLGYITLDNVLSVLRDLRENHDYYMKYEESGRFFIEEMELKRRLARKEKGGIEGWADWLALTIYKALSLYGESYLKPLGWAILTILLTALWKALPTAIGNSLLYLPREFLRQIRPSIAAFLQLRWDETIPTLIERILSIPILGSLYISLRRKLERRIRH